MAPDQGKYEATLPDGTTLSAPDAEALARVLALVRGDRRTASTRSTVRRAARLERPDLRRVAEVYEAAARDGRPARVAVARFFGASTRTASKWIAAARESGDLMLPPVKGRGGVDFRYVTGRGGERSAVALPDGGSTSPVRLRPDAAPASSGIVVREGCDKPEPLRPDPGGSDR